MKVEIEDSWKPILKAELNKSYFNQLMEFLDVEYKAYNCYPPYSEIFSAFAKSTFENTKVVILGQDPYHGPLQAHGLCFSVNKGVKIPPSLLNIFKELQDDLGLSIPQNGDLSSWAEQGVLLLNTTLTVRERKAGSHQKKGWELFTDAIINSLSRHKENLVFMLWGNYAQKKGNIIDNTKHLILKSKHPSPLSANSGGWFGQKHFSKCNAYLIKNKKEPINWALL